MNQDEALKKAQNDISKKGPFFQTEMAQYAIQLGFEKGSDYAMEKLKDWIETNIKHYLGWTAYNGDCSTTEVYLTDDFYSDLKKAMNEN